MSSAVTTALLASPEEEEEEVECERRDDQKNAGGVLDGHRASSGSGFRSSIARKSHVSSPKTTAPLAPKFVNWS